MLDNVVTTLGAKAKVVMAVVQEIDNKLDKDSLHRELERRNAFAHHATVTNFAMEPGQMAKRNFYTNSGTKRLW